MFGLGERKQFKEIKKASEPLYESPTSVQEAIDVLKISVSGIFEVTPAHYSKSYRLQDINYTTRNEDEELEIFDLWCKILNSFSVPFKITLNNKPRDKDMIRSRVLFREKADGLNEYRGYFNAHMQSKILEGKQGIEQEMYFTVTLARPNFEEAKQAFIALEATMAMEFDSIGSELTPLSGQERLSILHDFYRIGDMEKYELNISDYFTNGGDWKNDIACRHMNFNENTYYFRSNGKYCQALYLHPKTYPNSIRDDMLIELANRIVPSMVTIDYTPVPKDVVKKVLEDKYMGIETEITKQVDKRTKKGNFISDVSYFVKKKKQDVEEMIDDVNDNDQSMLFTTVSILVICNTKEEMEKEVSTIKAIAKGASFTLEPYPDQRRALNTILPIGVRQVEQCRGNLTQTAAAFLPFNVQELQIMEQPFFYGINQVSKNAVLGNRKLLPNGNGLVFAVPGAGKSFNEKNEMSAVLLNTEDDLIICDPTHEYFDFCKDFGGAVLNLASYTNNHINPLDCDVRKINPNTVENLIREKGKLVLGICDNAIETGISGGQKSIIDRCLRNIYHGLCSLPVEERRVPLMEDFWSELKKQEEPEVRELVLVLEIFIKGSLNIFNHATNIDIKNRFICYGIRDLGEDLGPVAMLVMLEDIANRIQQNFEKGVATWLYVDEFHELMKKPYSRQYFFSLWKKVRKLGGLCTGITQNLSDVLKDDETATFVANSEFLVLLRQGSEDIKKILDSVPEISDAQIKYIRNSPKGTGLIKHGNIIIPFDNRMDKQNPMYDLFNTDFHEKQALKRMRQQQEE